VVDLALAFEVDVLSSTDGVSKSVSYKTVFLAMEPKHFLLEFEDCMMENGKFKQ